MRWDGGSFCGSILEIKDVRNMIVSFPPSLVFNQRPRLLKHLKRIVKKAT